MFRMYKNTLKNAMDKIKIVGITWYYTCNNKKVKSKYSTLSAIRRTTYCGKSAFSVL